MFFPKPGGSYSGPNNIPPPPLQFQPRQLPPELLDPKSSDLSEAQRELTRRRSEAFHSRPPSNERLVYNVNEPIPLIDPANALLFSSEFESGNLERAYQVCPLGG